MSEENKVDMLIDYFRGKIDDPKLPDEIDDNMEIAENLDALILVRSLFKRYFPDDNSEEEDM